MGRLSAAAAAERLERRLDDVVDITEGCSSVGMTFVAPWERRTPPGLLTAARTDLRERRAAPQCAPQADLARAA